MPFHLNVLPPPRGSFHGGTDVDKPLQLSLERLQKAEWCQVGRPACGCPHYGCRTPQRPAAGRYCLPLRG